MAVRVGMVSLGCPKNLVDAETMLYDLREAGYEIVPDAALADIVIVNTCGFIESAKQEAIDTILEFCTLKDEGRIKAVAVTGCLAERYKEEILSEIPEVNAVVGIGKNSDICEIVKCLSQGESGIMTFDDKDKLCIEGRRIVSTDHYAYLKIAEGCSNCCTYCAIPSIRGKLRSRSIESVVAEAKWLAKAGVSEIILVAQDTTNYGFDLYGEPRLAKLLEELCKIDGIRWIRTLYCYPERITDELLDVVAREDKIVNYLDIPMQHCNGDILKAMNRKGDNSSLRALVEKIRAKIPDITLRTTLIAGFPGETQEQFEELCRFVKDVRFDKLGCFTYSAEEGTAAEKLPDQIDFKTKEERCDEIMNEQMLISYELNEQKIGNTYEVVCEGFDRYAECFFGRGRADAPEIDGKIFFSSASGKKYRPGEYVNVTIDDVLDYDLIGTVND